MFKLHISERGVREDVVIPPTGDCRSSLAWKRSTQMSTPSLDHVVFCSCIGFDLILRTLRYELIDPLQVNTVRKAMSFPCDSYSDILRKVT